MRTVFITGATGVVGCEVAPRLLKDSETEVRLLIRAETDDHLKERFQILRDYWGEDFRDSWLERVRLLRGDVCQPHLGLEPADYQELSETVTNVLHAAGDVKLNQSIADARRTAVGGLKEIIDLCRACQDSGGFRKLDYVSTVGVAGRMPGLIPERRLTEPRKFHNTYEQAKAEAEDLLWDEMERDLPATIHRPSMVVGDSKTGKILQFQVFYHLCEFLSGRRTMGFLPDFRGATLDVIPVDYVAEVIDQATRHDESKGQVFHLCSGPNETIPLRDLAVMVRDTFAVHNREYPKPRVVSASLIGGMMPLVGVLGYARKWRSLRSLPELFRYLKTRRSQLFETTRTDHFSSKPRFIPSPSSYLPTALARYCREKQESRIPQAAEGSKREQVTARAS